MKRNKTISIEIQTEKKGLELVEKLGCKSFSGLVEKLIIDRCEKTSNLLKSK